MNNDLVGEIVPTPGELHPYRVVVRAKGKVILSIDCDDLPGCTDTLMEAMKVIKQLTWDVV